MSTKIYEIKIHGCDDYTVFDLELTEVEKDFMEMLSRKSKEVSTYGCQPTIEIEQSNN